MSVQLNDSSVEKLRYYIDNGVLDKEIFSELYTSKTLHKIAEVFRKYHGVNQFFIQKYLFYIHNKVNADPKQDSSLDSYLAKRDQVIMRELLRSRGVLIRSKLRKNYRKAGTWDKAMDTLERMEIGYLVVLDGSHDAIFILDYGFAREVDNS